LEGDSRRGMRDGSKVLERDLWQSVTGFVTLLPPPKVERPRSTCDVGKLNGQRQRKKWVRSCVGEKCDMKVVRMIDQQIPKGQL
jgi:hypothetical protein